MSVVFVLSDSLKSLVCTSLSLLPVYSCSVKPSFIIPHELSFSQQMLSVVSVVFAFSASLNGDTPVSPMFFSIIPKQEFVS